VSEYLRRVESAGNAVRVIEQAEFSGWLAVETSEAIDALVGPIVRLAARGAPALGMALAMHEAEREGCSSTRPQLSIGRIGDARATAVRLPNT
jgi:methylthioribose-1-phosphate isomerase